MRHLSCAILLASGAMLAPALPAQSAADLTRLRPAAQRITAAALADSQPHRRLAALVDGFGHRFSGSASLERALDWILAEMQRDGFANVRGEPVMVPHWVRGTESATLIAPRQAPLHLLGLGGSVGTGPDGIEAEVLVVHSFDELERRKSEAAGKIVLFNVPFHKDSAPFAGYDVAARYRGVGATAAAKSGAVASLIRSVATFSMQSPHTGGMRYDSATKKIPAAAPTIAPGEGEADVGPIVAEGVPGFALDVDASKYFWYHHTSSDVLSAVSDAHLRRCIAAMAILAYALAEMPGSLR